MYALFDIPNILINDEPLNNEERDYVCCSCWK